MANEKQWLILSGRLGKDIEQKTTKKGKPYVSFRFGSDCGGETMWYSVYVFGDKVPVASKFFKKGDALILNTEMMKPHLLKLLDFKFPTVIKPKENNSDEEDVELDFDSIEEIAY